MKCEACGYDLRAHAVGDSCPECGRIVRIRSHWTPAMRRLGPYALAALVVLAPLSTLVYLELPILPAWITAQILFVVFVATTLVQHERVRESWPLLSVSLLTIASAIPTLTLALFIAVFIVGGGSNVRQLSGSSDLWSLWANFWPLLLIGNPVSVFLSLGVLASRPYQARYVASWALPLSCLLMALAAGWIAVTYFPDA